MLEGMFKKTPVRMERREEKRMARLRQAQDKAHVPDGMFQKCPQCGTILYGEDVAELQYICPSCGYYFRISAHTRLDMVLDYGSFTEWDGDVCAKNPLNFPGYEKKLSALRAATQLEDAVLTGEGLIRGCPVAIGVMSADFMMGSMGSAVGERITRLIERATEKRLPVVLFCCSGGARMQEGIVSLMQMVKTSQAIKRHKEAGLLYVSVLTDPTTGGVTASFAMLGDVILAEPGALIGFAGPRVIEQTIKQKLPEGFQKAEFLLEHGFVDRIVRRGQLRKILEFLIRSAS